MSRDWPADPADPRCPECGEAVSATANYCMHCEADLPTVEVDHRTGRQDGADSTDADATDAGDGDGDDAGGDDGWSPPYRPPREDESAPLDPDSMLDDVSTVAVGAVGGFLVAVLLSVLVLFATEHWAGFLVLPVAWVGVGFYVAWTHSVFGAVRKAAYLLALAIVAFPLFWFTPPVEGGTFGGRVIVFVVTEVVAVPVALGVAGLGYWLGGKAPGE